MMTVAEASRVFALLADEARLRILVLLARRGAASASALAELCGLSPPGTSHHLRVLRLGGVVDCRPRGHHRYYSLCSRRVRHLLKGVTFQAPPRADDGKGRQPRE